MNAAVVARECCAWPVLVRLPGDALGLVHFNRPSHGLVEGDLAALVSHDHGATWRDAGLAAPHAPGANRMHTAAGLDHAGRWLVLSTGFQLRAEGGYGELQPPWVSRRETSSLKPDAPTGVAAESAWTVNRAPPLAMLLAGATPHGRILALPDGRLAATFYRSEGRDRPSRAWVAFSRDAGASWLDARELGRGDANEVVLLRRAADDWLAVVRTHVDHHLELHASNDEGATWSFRRDLTLPLQHPGDLTDLGEGRVLLTYGIRNRGLMAIGARLSRDGGHKWGAPAVLYQFGEAADCGYPSTVVCADGSLLTACYSDLSPLHRGYHLLTLSWRLEEFTGPRS